MFIATQKIFFLEGVEKNADFYFCHSYRMTKLRTTDFVATSYYGDEFISAYRSKNIFGAQFHPEKSQTNGLRVLLNFLRVAMKMQKRDYFTLLYDGDGYFVLSRNLDCKRLAICIG